MWIVSGSTTRPHSITLASKNIPDPITSLMSIVITAGARAQQWALAFPALAQQPAPPQQRGRRQVRQKQTAEQPARASPLRQAQPFPRVQAVLPLEAPHPQQPHHLHTNGCLPQRRRRLVHLRTPHQQRVHTRLAAAGHTKQLLRVLGRERRALHQQKKGAAQEGLARKRRRQVAAAKPERDRKVSEVHQKQRAPVKRQRDHITAREENARPAVQGRNLPEENNRFQAWPKLRPTSLFQASTYL